MALNPRRSAWAFIIRFFALCALANVLGSDALFAGSAPAAVTRAESMDELYDKAKKEGGQLTLYIALSARREILQLR